MGIEQLSLGHNIPRTQVPDTGAPRFAFLSKSKAAWGIPLLPPLPKLGAQHSTANLLTPISPLKCQTQDSAVRVLSAHQLLETMKGCLVLVTVLYQLLESMKGCGV